MKWYFHPAVLGLICTLENRYPVEARLPDFPLRSSYEIMKFDFKLTPI
jgi:hypothetical protein